MKPPTTKPFSPILGRSLLFLAAVTLVAIVILVSRHPLTPPNHPTVAQTESAESNLQPKATATTTTATAAVSSNRLGFQKLPFSVAYESPQNQWTRADGKDTNVIRQLAHNPLEYERMMRENDSIKRRQLVYRKEPITVTIDRARNAGEPVRSFTLPGLDGQEYTVEVTQNSVERERMAGSLAGHLKGRPHSIVSIGFADGYESFNLISPEDGIFLTAYAREPGEVVVNQFDPETYGLPPQTDLPDFIPTK